MNANNQVRGYRFTVPPLCLYTACNMQGGKIAGHTGGGIRNSTMNAKKELFDLLGIPETAVSVRFVRAGGPGGQKVNKTSSAVRLFFNTHCLDEAVQKRLQQIPRAKLSKNGTLLVVAREHRSQQQNMAAAYQRLSDMLSVARRKPKIRIPTKRTNASNERRLTKKKQHSQKKAERKHKPTALGI